MVLKALFRAEVKTEVLEAVEELPLRMVGEPAGSHVAEAFNRRAVVQASIPGSGGLFSARGLARHYAMLANWGVLDGVRVLPEARIRAGIELQTYEWDEIYRIRARRGLGYRRGIDTGLRKFGALIGDHAQIGQLIFDFHCDADHATLQQHKQRIGVHTLAFQQKSSLRQHGLAGQHGRTEPLPLLHDPGGVFQISRQE